MNGRFSRMVQSMVTLARTVATRLAPAMSPEGVVAKDLDGAVHVGFGAIVEGDFVSVQASASPRAVASAAYLLPAYELFDDLRRFPMARFW